MIYYTLPGYFLRKCAINLRHKLEGQTMLNFHCELSGDDVNTQITISTNQTQDRVELRDTIMHYLALSLSL